MAAGEEDVAAEHDLLIRVDERDVGRVMSRQVQHAERVTAEGDGVPPRAYRPSPPRGTGTGRVPKRGVGLARGSAASGWARNGAPVASTSALASATWSQWVCVITI